MTRDASAAIDIRRPGRNGSGSSDGIDDMSVVGSPSQFPASYVDVSHHDVSMNQGEEGAQTPNNTSNPHLSSTTPMSFLNPSHDFAVEDVPLLPGEEFQLVATKNSCHLEEGTIGLTNYRIVFLEERSPQILTVFPLLGIEVIDFRDNTLILITMKEGRIQKFTFHSYEDAVACHRNLTKIVTILNRRPMGEEFEAFAWYYAEAIDKLVPRPSYLCAPSFVDDVVQRDFDRLRLGDTFRISDVNKNFAICDSYPEQLIVPLSLSDDEIAKAAVFRSNNRFPSVVYRSTTRGVLLRSAQPRQGLLAWRNEFDEKLLAAIQSLHKSSLAEGEEARQFVILDARSFTSAMANRARGGGYEYSEYYQQANVEFIGLPNIHVVRNSFVALRNLLLAASCNDSLLTALQQTGWLQNLSSLLSSSAKCADLLAKGHSVLVHCSDGWDRTTQMVCIAKIILDGYYRTIKGFEEILRREWLAFGHKFFDRQQSYTGNWDTSERCPIFLQFLEAVRHLQRDQPTAFQFTHAYLIKLAQHVYSGLFGTFLFNSEKERKTALIARGDKPGPIEIWRYLGQHNEEFVNQSYDDKNTGRLRPVKDNMINLHVWHEVFADDVKFNDLYAACQVPSNNSPHAPATPNRETVERPSSGTGMLSTSNSTSSHLQKSKSSESINSINNIDSSHLHGNLTPSDAACSSSTSNVAISTPTPGTETPSALSFSVPSGDKTVDPKVNILESIDNDGLLKFKDDDQEVQRRNKAKLISLKGLFQDEIREKDAQIQQLKEKRERSASERTGGSRNAIFTSPRSFKNSLCEDSDFESSLDRAMSDISVLDPMEVPYRSGAWEVNSDGCALCEKKFSMMNVHGDDRQHHCRNCGRAVCGQCSAKTYHTVEEGKGVPKRVCDECYDRWSRTVDAYGRSNGDLPLNTRSASSASLYGAESAGLPFGSPQVSASSPLVSGSSHPSRSGSSPLPSSALSSTPIQSPPRPVTGTSPSDNGSPSFARIGSTQAVKG